MLRLVDGKLVLDGPPPGAPGVPGLVTNSSFGPMTAGGAQSARASPYGAVPLVNPNQINPAKPIFDGGVSFKNILQEKLSKHIHRPLQTGDVNYNVTGYKPTKICTLTLPCLGPEHTYLSDNAMEDKQAGQMAAAKALEALYPDVYAACLEAHKSGEGGADIDPMGEPKSCLNQLVQLCSGRPLEKTDIVYETYWNKDVYGYVSTVTLHTLSSSQYTSTLTNCTDQRQAEKSAARAAIEANKVMFDEAKQQHDAKKAREAQKNEFYKGGKGGKGGKSFGKGKGGNRFPGYR